MDEIVEETEPADESAPAEPGAPAVLLQELAEKGNPIFASVAAELPLPEDLLNP